MAEYVYGFVPFEEIPEFKMVRREEVVRCRDCKHAFDEGSGYLYCGRRPGHCFETRADGFCAWGKRKEVSA